MGVEFQAMPRTGRRPGPNTTRAAILEAARGSFAALGYNATSLRTVAADAGVDAAVVLHFFGSKDGLFRAVVGWPFDPAQVETELTAEGDATLARRLARVFFSYWESPTTGPALVALLRSAMTHAEASALLREFLVHELFARVTGLIGGARTELRIELASAHLVGIALLRYVLLVEPIASEPVASIVEWVTPALERYLDATVWEC
jgi:AcrR family transcriptional regulator